MFKVKDLQGNGKLLNYQSLKMGDVVKLCQFINEMFNDGYVIDDTFAPRLCPKIPRIFNLAFIKAETKKSVGAKTDEELEEIEDIEEVSKEGDSPLKNDVDIDTLSKKLDLLDFAKKNEIEVPEDMTHPMSIKKFIKEAFDNE